MLDLHHAFLLSPILYNLSAAISHISKLTNLCWYFWHFLLLFLLIKRKAQKS